MNKDPAFSFNAELPNVSNVHEASLTYYCGAGSADRATTPALLITEQGWSRYFATAPDRRCCRRRPIGLAVRRLEVLREEGAPEVVTDNPPDGRRLRVLAGADEPHGDAVDGRRDAGARDGGGAGAQAAEAADALTARAWLLGAAVPRHRLRQRRHATAESTGRFVALPRRGDARRGEPDMSGFTTLDGDITLVPGGQGGFHVWVKYRVTGAGAEDVLAHYTARRISDGRLILKNSNVLWTLGEPRQRRLLGITGPDPGVHVPEPAGHRRAGSAAGVRASRCATRTALCAVARPPRLPRTAPPTARPRTAWRSATANRDSSLAGADDDAHLLAGAIAIAAVRIEARAVAVGAVRRGVDRVGRDAGAFQQQPVRQPQIDVPLVGHAAR